MKKDEDSLLSLQKTKINMLDKRHRERQINLENKHTLKMRETAEGENLDYFMETFLDRFREVELNLNNIEPNESALLTKQFNRIALNIQELQGYLSSSTLFLPDYSVKLTQKRIDDLVQNFEEVKCRLIPKKKFGFKAKQAETTATVQPVKKMRNDSDEQSDMKMKITDSVQQKRDRHIDWTINDRTNEEILLEGEDVNNKDLSFSTLTNCLIRIIGHPGSMQVSNLQNCLVLCGPVARSVFADNCNGTKFIFGCQQFRCHTSKDCQAYMHVTCRAIIEDCHGILVAPYSYSYENIELDFLKSGLDPKTNNWQDVADFNWLSADRVSPNWREIREEDRIYDWQLVIDQFRREMVGR